MAMKKKYGQNFLNNKQILASMSDKIKESIQENSEVIEIGPGDGVLTSELVANCAKYTAIEIDEDLWQGLTDKFSAYPNFCLEKKDFREFVFPATESVLIGNIPYYLSLEIIESCVENAAKISLAFFCTQKEFAKKVCAKPGETDYSYLTVYSDTFFEKKYFFKIPAKSFNPQPKVDSAFFCMKKRLDVNMSPEYKKMYLTFLRKLFTERNRKLSKVLSMLGIESHLEVDSEKRVYEFSHEILSKIFFMSQVK